MNTPPHTATAALASLALASITATAAPLPIAAKSFDTDGDGKISRKEQDVYLIHLNNETFRNYDVNKDGAISKAEAESLVEKANKEATRIKGEERAAIDLNAGHQGINPDAPMNPEDFDSLIRQPKSPGYEAGWFRMRAKVSDFSVDAKNRDDLLKVPAATFSYARDYEKDSDTWSAIGAIGAFWDRPNVDIALGAEFNRMDTNAAKKADVDSLVFKAMASGTCQSDLKSLLSYYWRAGLDYGTNSDFEGGLLGVNADFEPVWNDKLFLSVRSLAGTENGRSASNSPALSLRNILHLEGGGVVSDFSTPTKANDDYFRVGPQLEATFWPLGTEFPLSLTSSYAYYAGLLDEDDDYRNFRIGAEWRLDELGQFTIKAEYVNGMTPLLLEDQETLLFSLGVRY
jgi:hypothetical protein